MRSSLLISRACGLRCAGLGRYCGILGAWRCLLYIRYIFLRDALRIVGGRRKTFCVVLGCIVVLLYCCIVVLLYCCILVALLRSFGASAGSLRWPANRSLRWPASRSLRWPASRSLRWPASRSLGEGWWTWLRPIRTAGEIDLKIVIEPEILIPLYQKLSEKVKKLRVLGMSMTEIAQSLRIDPKTALKSYRFNGPSLNTPSPTDKTGP